MESDQAVLIEAAHHYGITVSKLTPLSGGHFSQVYEFSRQDKGIVLRITPCNDEIDLKGMRSIVEWMYFLARRGAAVSEPITSQQGNLIEVLKRADKAYLLTAFEKAPGVLAETIPISGWDESLFQRLGSVVGKIHTLSKAYLPPHVSLKRPEWNQIGNCYNPGQQLDSSQALLQKKKAELLDYLYALPKDAGCYGLIHADLHFGNLFVDPASHSFTIFDFDDCAYGWYVMDIAMSLFDSLVLYDGSDQQAFAGRFLQNYLAGYLKEHMLPADWVKQLPHFLKLLEIGLYTQLYQDYDPQTCDSWTGKFMPGRRSRLERDYPYIDLDFEALSESIC